jgi:hypothetical protein
LAEGLRVEAETASLADIVAITLDAILGSVRTKDAQHVIVKTMTGEIQVDLPFRCNC